MPAWLIRCLEWWLSLTSSGDGQAAQGRFVLGPEAGSEYSLVALPIIAAAAAACVIVAYVGRSRTLPWRRRLVLLTLRLLTAALLVLMLGRLSLQIERQALPPVAVLIDVSASMSLSDRYDDARVSRTVRALVPASTATPPTRLQLVQALLTRDRGSWWTALQATHQPSLYVFDALARPVDTTASTAAGAAEQPAFADAVRALTAAGRSTAPATAVRDVLEDFRGQALSAIVLFTDGVASAGDDERLTRAALPARERGVPLYCVPVGSRDPVRDLELFDLLADDVAYLDEPYTLSLRQRSFGLQDRTTKLTVTVAGESEPLWSQTITAGPNRAAEALDVTIQLPEEGQFELHIAATPLEGEADLENNVLHHRVEVRREALHVLLVEGRPRWEYRALKPVLERDDTLQLDSYLHAAEPGYVAEDRTALKTLPAAPEQWERYDVVVWGDVDLDALPGTIPAQLRAFVVEYGGGLVLISGAGHNPVEYAGTDLDVLLPVSVGAAQGFASLAEQPLQFRLERTAAAGGESFLRLGDTPQDDALVWQSLPPNMDWLTFTPEVKPGAEVLAVGPLIAGRAAPLIVRQRVGRGQVLYHGTDTLWTWRKRVEDRHYGRYWSQAIRAVAPRRGRGADGWELTSDRRVYEPGDVVTLRLRGPASAAGGVESMAVMIESLAGTGGRFPVELAPQPEDAARWQGVVRDLPPGDYRAGVVAAASAAGCRFRCAVPDRELRDRAAAVSDLEQAARTSRGAVVSLADAERLPGQLPRGKSVRLSRAPLTPLWSRWELVLLLTAGLAVEWILRRRWRLV